MTREGLFGHVSLLPIAMAGLLAGCETSEQASAPVPTVEIAVTSKVRSIVETGVGQNLKDPYSAHFGPMRAAGRDWNGHHEIVACGYVNAKNSFGGYNGQQPFVAKFDLDGSNFQLVAMGDESPNAGLLVKGACRGAGIPI